MQNDSRSIWWIQIQIVLMMENHTESEIKVKTKDYLAASCLYIFPSFYHWCCAYEEGPHPLHLLGFFLSDSRGMEGKQLQRIQSPMLQNHCLPIEACRKLIKERKKEEKSQAGKSWTHNYLAADIDNLSCPSPNLPFVGPTCGRFNPLKLAYPGDEGRLKYQNISPTPRTGTLKTARYQFWSYFFNEFGSSSCHGLA